MSVEFFEQVDDELRGLLGPAYFTFECRRNSRVIKLWKEEARVHFEAQQIGPRWAPKRKPVIEVGVHFELPTAKANDELLARMEGRLPRAEGGRAFGPQGSSWRRFSELIQAEDLEDPELASEVAELLVVYIQKIGTALP